MELINLPLTNHEAFVLRTLLFTRLAGIDGAAGTLLGIERKLNELNVGAGHMTVSVNKYGNVTIDSLTY